MPKPRNHTVKKKETIESIAKSYGFRDWKEIWKYPDNRALVSKRKEAKNLEPGDELIVPAMNEAEREAFLAKRRELNMAIGIEGVIANKLELKADALEKAAVLAEAQAKSADETWTALSKELAASANSAKTWSDGVDVAAFVINLTRSIGQLATKSSNATKLIDQKELAKADAVMMEMHKDCMKMAYEPINAEAQKAAGKYLADPASGTGDLKLALGAAIESYGKLTAPSFWGKTMIALADGKSWSEAATYDYEAEVKDRLDVMEATRKRTVDAFRKAAASARKEAAACRAEATARTKKAKALKKEVAALEAT